MGVGLIAKAYRLVSEALLSPLQAMSMTQLQRLWVDLLCAEFVVQAAARCRDLCLSVLACQDTGGLHRGLCHSDCAMNLVGVAILNKRWLLL